MRLPPVTPAPQNLDQKNLPSWIEPLRRLTQTVPSEPNRDTEGSVCDELRAAVVVLVVEQHLPVFLMTARSTTLHEHGGEVAFPGGRIEARDADPAAAALRELREEVGIAPSCVEPLGYLPGIRTRGSRYWVMPLLAWLPGSFDFSARNPSPEVEYAFGLSLAIALDPRRYDRKLVPGTDISVPMLIWEGPLIWGATARILMSCADQFDPAARDLLR
ncbi:MAG: NUDIX hydrolase [Gammaproteobacteria bacterium]